MKKIIITIVLLLIYAIVHAQINLVKNPGFEKYNHLPNGFDQIKYANFWSPSDTVLIDTVSDSFYPVCSPEFCYKWDSAGIVGVPLGGGYYHYPHTGNGMAQEMMFANYAILDTGLPSYQRDYLQGRLYTKLIAGHIYCVSFYVTLEQISAFAINHIGVYLDDGSMDTARWCAWPQTSHIPQVYATEIIFDTLNWVKIEGSFTANGTEKFITIGNFFDSAHTDKVYTNFFNVHTGDTTGNRIYTCYLIDDVSVIPIDAHANAGIDRITSPHGDSVWVGDTTGYLPCYWYANGVLIDSNTAGFKAHPDSTTHYVMVLNVCGNITTDTMVVRVYRDNVPYFNALENLIIYPNPVTNLLTIDGAGNSEITLFDMMGRVILNRLGQQHLILDISSLTKGVYSVEVRDIETGMKVMRKIIKE